VTGEFVTSAGHQDLDGLNIKPPEVMFIGSELAKKLIGRDFSKVSVSAEVKNLVWVTVCFPAIKDDVAGVDDIATLRAMAEQVASEKLPRETGDFSP
jgi:hypothetical protein